MVKVPPFPAAYHDFSKGNGTDGGFATEGPSLTRQEFAEECDINSLMKRYEGHVTGGPGNLPPNGEMMYADFAATPTTLMEYMEYMDMAQAEFMKLPAVVRKEFDNNAHAFCDFAADPYNLPQLVTWGLAHPKAVEKAAEKAAGAVSSPPAAGAAPPENPPGGASTHGAT